MSDTPTPDAPTPDPAKPDPDKPNTLPDDPAALKAEIDKLRREAAGYRTKAKELEPLAAKAKELEEASKTETQKLAEARDLEKARGDKAETELLRLTVGLDKGLTPAQAKRLVGATKEELEADADAFLAETAPAEPAPGGRPKERLRPGTGRQEPLEETDPAKLAEMVPRGY